MFRVLAAVFAAISVFSSAEGYDSAKMRQIFEASPAVALIEVYKTESLKSGPDIGTGVLIPLSSAGESVILTNNHVVEKSGTIYVSFHKRGAKITPTLIGRDPIMDLAILGISEIPRGITPAKIGDSSLLRHGDEVYALGHAFGERLVTAGNITALKFHGWRWIVSQTPLNPGNSGGPLFNKEHEVVALNTAIAQGANLVNFSIPMNYVKRLLPRLLREGVVRHATFGLELSDSFALPPFFFKNRGLRYPPEQERIIVMNVLPGSPGAEASVREGDTILKLNGVSYAKAEDLDMKIFFDHRPGDRVLFTVERNGQIFEKNTQLSDWVPR